jgi:anti-anti-sigma factor
MARDRQNRRGGECKAKQVHAIEPQAEPGQRCTSIHVERSGDWMPAEDFREAALGALEADGDVTVNLDQVGHLDGSALQILLALETELRNRGRNLRLENASPHLQQWFEFAGTADRSFHDGANKQ